MDEKPLSRRLILHDPKPHLLLPRPYSKLASQFLLKDDIVLLNHDSFGVRTATKKPQQKRPPWFTWMRQATGVSQGGLL
jgi:hypothetical protein